MGDAGNLAYGIMSLFDYPIYSQHNYYFIGYGWIFNDINFFLILLLKGIGQLLGFYDQSLFGIVDNQPLFNATIRAVNFAFALASILLFLNLSNLLFDNKKISLVASLFFMFCPWSAVYSYWLKTDATGMFFILLSIWCLIKFIRQEQKLIYFYVAFISLILTTFSKMYHGFYLFPIFLLFFLSYCDRKK
ncbi:membrane protein [Beggiatoa sp. PS]|nr:membrane protein [Beggiatoa sp. PS]